MTAKIKLNAASGGGSFSLQAPSSSSNNRIFTLPDVADATMATVNGITEVDMWGVSSDVSSDTDPITTWSRITSNGSASPLGTGMSVSSGIFTFPSTGKYLIFSKAKFSINDADSVAFNTLVTLDDSSYAFVTACVDGLNGSGQNRDGGDSTMYFLDVTDTSQVKVKFSASSLSSGSVLKGGSTFTTGAIFIRMGDT